MTDRDLATLTPMWQRIARGEINLSQYTDEEILSAQITMADGRLLPTPAVIPDTFIQEQVRRGFRVAERKVREGAVRAMEVLYDILDSPLAEDKDRIQAAKFFTDRFLGKAEQRLTVTHQGDGDPRELLIQRLLAAKQIPSSTQGEDDMGDDVVEAEIVPDLEDLL